jgi:two-component system LytT family response regulator
MRALIVDDEPLARRELRRLLAEHREIEIVGEAANNKQALALNAELAPDLLFLDIQMPGGSGFDLLGQLAVAPQVIFTTAHDHHAVHAFEHHALDYLLKPIDPQRLARALARLKGAPGAPPPLERMFVRDGDAFWFVPLRELPVISAEGNYARLSWGKRELLLMRSLNSLEQQLAAQRFFRANRRQIINLDFVEKVELGFGGRLNVTLRGGLEVVLSRRQARVFKARLG